jgi:hypothetical protein
LPTTKDTKATKSIGRRTLSERAGEHHAHWLERAAERVEHQAKGFERDRAE